MTRNPYHSGPVTDHFDGTRFFNPGHSSPDRSFRDVLRWRSEGKRAPWPEEVPVTPAVPEERVDGLTVTMVGHASVLIQIGGLNVLTDPVWSQRVSPVSFLGPKRVTAPGVRFEDLPPIDLVLLSHSHYDHCDLDTLSRLSKRFRPRIVAPLGLDVLLRRRIRDVDVDVVAGDWGDEIALPAPATASSGPDRGGEARIAIVPAQHWSRRGWSDTRMTLWSGFVLKAGDRSVYFLGDSGYGDGSIFRAVRERHGAPDLALIPIGAYAPRWFMEHQHMNPEEAVRVFEDVGAGHAVAIHWGTVQLTDEPRDEPVERLAEAAERMGVRDRRFMALAPGECLDLAGGSAGDRLEASELHRS
ncbi:MBL fold metallo-hydrolase [Aurantimonas sp. 22II-16-19i]|uniref:MBL fold metallo-hydrolase n=1 Tax=Aurantimonas sp. 22II-16-19i TaxID=1317114 RepID=UPI0009F7B3FF|nr:MBL fold metallo-hydrolase [Aurantimonas sp. 22II-16-19i]ORE88123.1 beta-lactamase-like protein [Aurantimonas sp. 22II-16-19i]